MDNTGKKECTKEKNEIEFKIAFKEDGESFQSIMEKILLNKISKY